MAAIIAILTLTAGAVLAGPLDGVAPPGNGARPAQEVDEESPQQQPLPVPPEALCLRGEHHLDDAGHDAVIQARRMFETAIEFYPGAACGHAGMSRALATIYNRRIEEDDALIDRALDEARRAIEIDPKSAVAHAALAGAMLADLKVEDADASVETALSLAPDSVPALQTAALVRLTRGHLGAARSAIDRAIQLRPDLPVSYHTLGNVELLSGRKVEAIDTYRIALRLSPDFVPSILQVAASYEELGNYVGAGQIFRQFLQDHPEDAARTYFYMGRSLMRRGGWEAALGAFAKADFKTHKGLSNGTLLYLKAICYEQLGRTEEARAAFRDVIDNWPDATGGLSSSERLIFPAYEGLGRLYLKAHDTEQAQTVMEEGIARSGASLDLYLKLAGLYQDYRLPDRAGALLEKAVARDLGPKNANKLLSVYVIGMRLARESRDEARLERLTRSLDSQLERLASLHDYVHDLDAMRAYSIAGRPERALEILRRSLKAGYLKIEWLVNDPDLEGLRATEGFKQLARSSSAGIHPSH